MANANTGLSVGDRVLTLLDLYPTGYQAGARDHNQWGVGGVVIERITGHGLCYCVRHDDGTEGVYEPGEVRLFGPEDAPPKDVRLVPADMVGHRQVHIMCDLGGVIHYVLGRPWEYATPTKCDPSDIKLFRWTAKGVPGDHPQIQGRICSRCFPDGYYAIEGAKP